MTGARRSSAGPTTRSPRTAGGPATSACVTRYRATNTYDAATRHADRRRRSRARPSTTNRTTTPTSSGTAARSTPSRRTRSPTRTARGSSRRSSSGRHGPRPPIVPATTVTYTSNWPHEALVGNRPTGEAIVWTGVSIIMLLGGIGVHGVVVRLAQARARRSTTVPDNDPLLGSMPTPSQRALVKYFWIVAGADPRADRAWA